MRHLRFTLFSFMLASGVVGAETPRTSNTFLLEAGADSSPLTSERDRAPNETAPDPTREALVAFFEPACAGAFDDAWFDERPFGALDFE